ncbi:MAG: D-alanyl-D-alanine carboxypeptidase/D-alanyl-D-alanine-endopeptidase [Deltaproteobacteria bacterium]|nr:D-alanyl-D-alanine carboxypeptidase/D-alanyl-D-alanine-endopeptidase [Deltaproteobacteria bacterium]
MAKKLFDFVGGVNKIALGRVLLTVFCLVFLITPSVVASPSDSQQKLKANIQKIIATKLRQTDVSVQVASIEGNKTDILFEHNPHLLLNPASNVKLVTSGASLALLGPDHSFPTRFYSAEEPQKGWVDHLWIKGFGDPLLINEEISKIVNHLALGGLRGVQKGIFVDTGFFDRNSKMTYFSEATNRLYTLFTGALSFNFNRRAKWMAMKNSRHRSRFAKQEEAYGDEPGLAELGSEKSWDPGFATGQAFKEQLSAAGIPVVGSVRLATVPDTAVLLYEHRSPPLSEIVRALNKFSNNFIAEQLVKTMGAVQFGPPGSTTSGIRVMEDYLSSLGIPPKTYALENGSGLSLGNRLSAAQFVQVLSQAYRDPHYASSYLSSLSIAGIDGTMRRRYKSSPLRSQVLGKTGSLAYVHCLSGYLIANEHPFAFSILVNNYDGSSGAIQQAEEKILREVNSYGRSL